MKGIQKIKDLHWGYLDNPEDEINLEIAGAHQNLDNKNTRRTFGYVNLAGNHNKQPEVIL